MVDRRPRLNTTESMWICYSLLHDIEEHVGFAVEASSPDVFLMYSENAQERAALARRLYPLHWGQSQFLSALNKALEPLSRV